MEIITRYYTMSDYEGLFELLNSIYNSNIDKQMLEENYITDKRSIILAVDEKNHVLGCVFTEIQDDYVRPSRILFITYVAVKESYRRAGIGRMLIRKIEEICRSENCSAIELTSADFRRNAHVFYECMGFTKKKTTVFIKEMEMK